MAALVNCPIDPQLGYVPTMHESAYADIQAPFRNVSRIQDELVEKVHREGLRCPGCD